MFMSTYFLVFFALKFPLAINGNLRRENPLHCTPTEVLQSDCFACRCSAQGYYTCWPLTCRNDNKEIILTRRSPLNLEPKCQPGVFYQTQNLTCSCSAHGLWFTNECENTFKSLKKIEEHQAEIQELVIKHTKQGLKCKPRSIYVADCNICVCSKDGDFHIELCTKRNCKMHHSEKCTPGSVIRTRCHFCFCSPSNTVDPKNCLKVPCDLAFKEIDVNALSEIDSRIGKGKHRRSMGEHAVLECVPKTFFMMDCNRCYCQIDGIPSCTLMGCLDPVEVDAFNTSNQRPRFGDEEINYNDELDRMKRDRDSETEDEVLFSDDVTIKSKRNNYLRKKLGGVSLETHERVKEKMHKGRKTDDLSEKIAKDTILEGNVRDLFDRIKRDTDYSDEFDEIDEISSDSDECVRQKIYKMDCNTCICIKSGNLACTTRVCKGDYDYVNNNNNPQYVLPELDRF